MLAYSTNPMLRDKSKYGRLFKKQRKDEARKQRERDNYQKKVDIAVKVTTRPKMQQALKAYYGDGIEDRTFRNLIYDEVWAYLNLSKGDRCDRLSALFTAVCEYLYEAYQLN